MSRRFERVISGENRSLPASVTRLALRAGEAAYRVAVKRRNATFDQGGRTPANLHRATISVGNLTTGGTGKTPVVLELAQRVNRMGRKPAILLRGYHGKEVDPAFTRLGEAGPPPPRFHSDEQMLYQEALGDDIPVAADPDRVRSAKHILHHRPDVDVFILDDGFQHRQVRRDLDIVLLDATCPFGFDHVLPRGLLREPVENLARADFVIVTRCDAVGTCELASIDRRVMSLTGMSPVAHAIHQWCGFVDHEHSRHGACSLGDMPLFGVCGLGNPTAFETAARAHLPGLSEVMTMKDHHEYTAGDVKAIFNKAMKIGAKGILTTDKDWVKIQRVLGDQQPRLPIYRPVLKIGFLKGSQMIDVILRRLPQYVEQDTVSIVLPADAKG